MCHKMHIKDVTCVIRCGTCHKMCIKSDMCHKIYIRCDTCHKMYIRSDMCHKTDMRGDISHQMHKCFDCICNVSYSRPTYNISKVLIVITLIIAIN